MPLFKVTTIIDGDTFEVSPSWQWRRQSGSRVRPTGYDATELGVYGGQTAKMKLSNLIIGKQVDLQTAYRVDRGRLVCDVYFGGKNLSEYFPEYKT